MSNLSRKSRKRIASLINEIEVACLMLQYYSGSDRVVWLEQRREATQQLGNDYSIILPSYQEETVS